MTIYQQHDYQNRADYLACPADDYDRPLIEVQYLADLLGPSEDFDALVTFLEDAQ